MSNSDPQARSSGQRPQWKQAEWPMAKMTPEQEASYALDFGVAAVGTALVFLAGQGGGWCCCRMRARAGSRAPRHGGSWYGPSAWPSSRPALSSCSPAKFTLGRSAKLILRRHHKSNGQNAQDGSPYQKPPWVRWDDSTDGPCQRQNPNLALDSKNATRYSY